MGDGNNDTWSWGSIALCASNELISYHNFKVIPLFALEKWGLAQHQQLNNTSLSNTI